MCIFEKELGTARLNAIMLLISFLLSILTASCGSFSREESQDQTSKKLQVNPSDFGSNDTQPAPETTLNRATIIGPPYEGLLIASDGSPSDNFGYDVEIAGDTIVIGAWGYDNFSTSNTGAAYVFMRDSMGWFQSTKLLPDDLSSNDNFGIAVSTDGSRIVVGARGSDDAGNNSGAAYVFIFRDGDWALEAKLMAWDGSPEDNFGRAVSISGDMLVVGSPFDDDACPKDPRCNSGAVYIFKRTESGWIGTTKLTAGDRSSGSFFGRSVDMLPDTIVVGAYRHDADAFDSGAAYVFEKESESWHEVALLKADHGNRQDFFGISVAISGDTIVVGADDYDSERELVDSGAAFVFSRGPDGWQQQATLIADDGEAGDNFGNAVDISGRRIVVGSRWHDQFGVDSGAAYVFERGVAKWEQRSKLVSSNAGTADFFGFSVALQNEDVVIGAYGDGDSGSSTDAAYIFDLNIEVAPKNGQVAK
jgi:hypothetical protein